MSKVETDRKGRISSVTVWGRLMEDGKMGAVSAVIDGKQNLRVHHSTRHVFDLMTNEDRGAALGKLLDIADGAGYSLVFPAVRPPIEESLS